ncbi:MAG: LuxR C-terminal-related transcriptional regulator [Porphyromonadaceae bacterium]|nr:LuxR C-terminal-related transcriptional regulator [Porphyromonadaceae bacterium]
MELVKKEIKDLFHAASVLSSDALFLYDHTNAKVVLADIRSEAIREAIRDKNISQVIEENNHFILADLSATSCWRLAKDITKGRLSMNICLDQKRMFFVCLQVVVVDIESEGLAPKYLLCSLSFSGRKDEAIVFVDRDNAKLWQYDFQKKLFKLLNLEPLTHNELEVVRLSRMGYTEKKISSILHKSLDTIRWYKKNTYEKLRVNNIQSCISCCETYHLL